MFNLVGIISLPAIVACGYFSALNGLHGITILFTLFLLLKFTHKAGEYNPYASNLKVAMLATCLGIGVSIYFLWPGPGVFFGFVLCILLMLVVSKVCAHYQDALDEFIENELDAKNTAENSHFYTFPLGVSEHNRFVAEDFEFVVTKEKEADAKAISQYQLCVLEQLPIKGTSAWGGDLQTLETPTPPYYYYVESPKGEMIPATWPGEIAMGGPATTQFLFENNITIDAGTSVLFSADGRYFFSPVPSRQYWDLLIYDRQTQTEYCCKDFELFWELDLVDDTYLYGRYSPITSNCNFRIALKTLFEKATITQHSSIKNTHL